MKKITRSSTIWLTMAVSGILLMASPARSNDAAADAVVKIFVTYNNMHYYKPWQDIGSKSSSGSGCVISGHRILTNAHVVKDNTFIQVRKESDPKKYTAKLEAIGHDCDLAILTVADPDFLENITPLEIGDLSNLQDTVTVIGFPEGGDKLSITKGVVSRVETVPYSQSQKKLLAVQIDAAINPGNSGGPVLQEGKIAGIAMQVMTHSQNIGYMIPPPIIKHFLTDLEDGSYDGFPLVGIDFTNTENKTLREFYKIENEEGGVLATSVKPFSPAHNILQAGDVVLAVDNVPVGVDGTFKFRNNERLSFSYLIDNKQINDTVQFSIMRNGEKLQKTIRLFDFKTLVPFPNNFKKPPYYIYNGLVFTVLSIDLLKTWGGRWWEKAPLDFLHYLLGSGRTNKKQQKNIVVLLNVLPDDVNVGYHDYRDEVITTVNGKSFDSFKEFVVLLEKNKKDFTIFETDSTRPIILNNKNAAEITGEILKRNNIPAQYSADVAGWIVP